MSDNIGGDIYLARRAAGAEPVKLVAGLEAPADLAVDHTRGLLLVPENSGNRLSVFRLGPAPIGGGAEAQPDGDLRR